MIGVEEIVVPQGLRVIRGGIGPELCAQLSGELVDLHGLLKTDFREGPVYTRADRLADVFDKIGPATLKILDNFNIGIDSRLFVNQQAPYAEQGFHRDGAPGIVLYPEGKGAFDIVIESPLDKTEVTIEVKAGDIILNDLVYLSHRGRNTSPVVRYTIGILNKKNNTP